MLVAAQARAHGMWSGLAVAWASHVAFHVRMGEGGAALGASMRGMAGVWFEGARALYCAHRLAPTVVGGTARGCVTTLEALAAVVGRVGCLG